MQKFIYTLKEKLPSSLISELCKCALCTVHWTWSCTVYSVHCTLYTVHYILYTVYCILYTVYCILYTVYCAPIIFVIGSEYVHCKLYSVQCTYSELITKIRGKPRKPTAYVSKRV